MRYHPLYPALAPTGEEDKGKGGSQLTAQVDTMP
jgi:hypothetical protein